MVFSLNGVVRDFVKDLNFKLEEQGLINYDYSEWIVNGEYNEACDNIIDNNLFWKNLKPFDDSWHQINYFFSQNIPIFISSPASYVDEAETWLDSWRIQYNQVINSTFEYYENLQQLQPSVIVCDSPQVITMCSVFGLNGILRRAWYNRDFWDTLPNIGNLFELKAFND